MITIHTDGGARGNPGPSAIGVVIDVNGQEHHYREYLGIQTNNIAEYSALIRAIEQITNLNLQSDQVTFLLDSELVVKQVLGQYKIKLPHLQILNQKVQSGLSLLKAKGFQINIQHIPRSLNKTADLLVNQELDSQVS